MEEYGSNFSLFGSLFVIVGGCIAIILSVLNRTNNSTAWTISGISLLIGIFVVSGNRITEIATPIGTIKTAAENAKNKVFEIEALADDVKKIKEESASSMKDIKANLAEVKKGKEESLILMKIMLVEEKIKRKQAIIEINNDPKFKILYNADVDKENQKMLEAFKNELNDLNEKLRKLRSN